MSQPEQQKLVVWHEDTASNREVEDYIADPRGGRWYWFVGQKQEEGWTNAKTCEAARDQIQT